MTREDREKMLREIKEKVMENKTQTDGDYLWPKLYDAAIMVSGVLDVVKFGEGVLDKDWENKTYSDQVFKLIHQILMEN